MAGASPSPGRFADPARIGALVRSGLLDEPGDPRMDRLVRLAARAAGTPAALIALVGSDGELHRHRHGPLSAAPDLGRRVLDAAGRAVTGDDTGAVAWMGVPLMSPDGHPLGALVVLDDGPRAWSAEEAEALADAAAAAGDELHRREDARTAEQAEAHFRQTFAAAPIGMGIQSLDRRWLRVNPALCAMLGHTERELTATTEVGLTVPEDRRRDAEHVAHVLSGATAEVRLVKRLRHADGHPIWVDVATSPARDEQGEPRHLVVQVQDITERRRAEEAQRTSEERFRMAMRHAPIGMAMLRPEGGDVLQVNEALCAMLGRDEADLVALRLGDLTGADDRLALRRAFGRVLAGEPSADPLPLGLAHVTGRPVAVNLHLALVRASDGAPLYAIAQMEDVSERKRLQAERARFFEVSMDMLCVFDAAGRFVDLSPAWQRTLGLPPADLLGRRLSEFLHPEDLERTRETAALVTAGVRVTDFENRFRCADGSYRWLRWSASLDPERRVSYCVAKDVTERRVHEAELVHLAAHDPLTGLLNRRAFAADLEAHLVRSRRYAHGGALLVLDLDDFKRVNDTLGHRAGDELLVAVARILRRSVRDSDGLARLGGDEFAVLLPEGGPAEAALVADKLVAAIGAHTPVLDGRRHPGVTTSIGVAVIPSGDIPADDLLACADAAMYVAKDRGGDGWSAPTRPDRPDRPAPPTWPDRIRTALEQDAFELYEQPIVDVASGLVTQHELLLRMRAPDGEIVPPADFLPAAERFDLVGRIDRWVLGQAVDLLASRRAGGPLEVNVSGASLGDPLLLEVLGQRIQRTGIDPSQLVLEITEASALADLERAHRFAERVGALGCRLALDDFGAGFGSFHFFESLPFHFLKIDGAFVTSCLTSRSDRLVVDAVVSWAHGLGKRTIAEFTPDAQTLDLLRELGVDLAQGHHIGRPRPLWREAVPSQ